MKKVLLINASSKIKRGFSRDLGDYLVSYLSSKIKLEQIVYRVLSNQEVPHITQEWLNTDTKSPEERNNIDLNILKYSNTCIQELREADIIILTTPMFHWSIPSVLKSYIDQVMRLNEVFKINTNCGLPASITASALSLVYPPFDMMGLLVR